MKKIFKVNQKKKKKLVNTLELPKEIIFNLPLITIVGNEEINIENYKGVIEYSPEKIRINTECGVLKINGEKLSFKQITAENIIVTGVIQTLEYLS